MTMPPDENEVSTIFEFPTNPARIPFYSNTCLVNISADDVFIDFGFLDTYPVPDNRKRIGPNGEQFIEVVPVTRVAMSLNIARNLHRQLSNVFYVLENYNSETGELNDPEK